MSTPAPAPAEIRVRRAPLATRHGLGWTYSFTVPERWAEPRPDSSPPWVAEAGWWLAYGPGLSSLRDMLRRRYGRDTKIIETWKS